MKEMDSIIRKAILAWRGVKEMETVGKKIIGEEFIGKKFLFSHKENDWFFFVEVKDIDLVDFEIRGETYNIDFGFEAEFSVNKMSEVWLVEIAENYTYREINDNEWLFIKNIYNQTNELKQKFSQFFNIKTK